MSIDERAYSKEKIIPPHPLPAVSRKALKRVREPLPKPETCRYCGPEHPVRIARHEEIYGGREFGDWPFMYLCDHCGARVGVHPGTDIPIGMLADFYLRKARSQNKPSFFQMVKVTGMTMDEAYQWLADAMGIPKEECHWGWFEIDQCHQAGMICEEELRHNMRKKES